MCFAIYTFSCSNVDEASCATCSSQGEERKGGLRDEQITAVNDQTGGGTVNEEKYVDEERRDDGSKEGASLHYDQAGSQNKGTDDLNFNQQVSKSALTDRIFILFLHHDMTKTLSCFLLLYFKKNMIICVTSGLMKQTLDFILGVIENYKAVLRWFTVKV